MWRGTPAWLKDSSDEKNMAIHFSSALRLLTFGGVDQPATARCGLCLGIIVAGLAAWANGAPAQTLSNSAALSQKPGDSVTAQGYGESAYASGPSSHQSSSIRPRPPRLPKKLLINLAWQIALAANDFSPGILDGDFGPHSRTALREYAESNFPGHNPFNPHDPAIFNALKVDVRHAIGRYTISNRDAQSVGHLHYHWRAMAAASRMPYSSLEDCICEKFHTTRQLLSRLNPGVNLRNLTVGQTLFVPNIRPFPSHNDFGLPGALTAAIKMDKSLMPTPHVAYLTINLKQRAIRAYNAHNREVALFRCSIPAHRADYPTTDAVIKDFALNPDYTFLPSVFHSVHNIHHPLLIPPGPRNPVGVLWMGLDIPNVGMHGNPEPQNIGITGSHGCFRMTNWDAVRLFTLIHIGLPVIMIDPRHPIPLSVALAPGLYPPGLSRREVQKADREFANAADSTNDNSAAYNAQTVSGNRRDSSHAGRAVIDASSERQ